MRSRRVAIVYHVSCIMQRTHRQSRPAGLGLPRRRGPEKLARRSQVAGRPARAERAILWVARKLEQTGPLPPVYWGQTPRAGAGEENQGPPSPGLRVLFARKTHAPRDDCTADVALCFIFHKKVACLPRETNEQTACTNSTNSRNRGPGPRASQPRRWRHPRTSGSRPPSICRPP